MRNVVLTMEEKKRLNKFVKEPHTMVIEYSKETKLFCISFPELPECRAKGKTIKEAMKNITSAKWTWGVACIINEHTLPKPKVKQINEEYVFISVNEKELVEINRRSWETKKSVPEYVKSIIIERILLLNRVIEPSKNEAVKDICEIEAKDISQKIQIDKSEYGVSQVAFAG